MLIFFRRAISQHAGLFMMWKTLREGRNFTALRVKAIQHNEPICHITAFFPKKQSKALIIKMPKCPDAVESPDQLIAESDDYSKNWHLIFPKPFVPNSPRRAPF